MGAAGGEGGHWNNRSRDVARLTEKMAKNFERPLSWQIVTHLSKPEDWMDAPLLFIAGSEDPRFSLEDIEKLRAYVEMGGIIFSSADGESAAFTEAVRKYASQIVPGREMRELPPTHPLFQWRVVDQNRESSQGAGVVQRRAGTVDFIPRWTWARPGNAGRRIPNRTGISRAISIFMPRGK